MCNCYVSFVLFLNFLRCDYYGWCSKGGCHWFCFCFSCLLSAIGDIFLLLNNWTVEYDVSNVGALSACCFWWLFQFFFVLLIFLLCWLLNIGIRLFNWLCVPYDFCFKCFTWCFWCQFYKNLLFIRNLLDHVFNQCGQYWPSGIPYCVCVVSVSPILA